MIIGGYKKCMTPAFDLKALRDANPPTELTERTYLPKTFSTNCLHKNLN